LKHPYAITPKHTPTGAAAKGVGTSYISDKVNGEQIFKFLTETQHPNPSGAELVWSRKHNSLNAICHKPLDEIPGSGISPRGHEPAAFAVLYDIKGNSDTGPHFAFYTEDQIKNQFANDWVRLPMCSSCNKITVFNAGDKCPNCLASGPTGSKT
jgi:hypothetical protein